jgi:hypothetical protein
MAANKRHAPDDHVEEAEVDHEAPAPGPDAPHDPSAIAERATADEAAATRARVRFRVAGMPRIDDDEVGPDTLVTGERLLAVRKRVALERRGPPQEQESGLPGTLYLTSLRLGLVGRHPVAIPIEGIRDTAVVGQRLVVGLRDGHYVWIQCERPRLLRVEIAAARALARASRARGERPNQPGHRSGTDRRGRRAVPERHGDRG